MSHWVSAEDLEDPTLSDADEAAAAASLIMFALSGRKYPGLITTREIYASGGSCAGFSSRTVQCGNHRKGVRLRHPVRAVHYVFKNASSASPVLVDPREYRMADRTYIKPTRFATWTACSDLEIVYTYGAVPPEAGRRAAVVLANQLLRARVRPDECGLPSRITSIARQGVTMTMLDSQDFLLDGRTGIYEVDLFLKSMNPDQARKRSRVFSPDVPRGEQLESYVSGGIRSGDLVVYSGLGLSRTFFYMTHEALTGAWTASAELRDHSGEVVADLTPLLTLEPGGVVGTIRLDIPAAATETTALFGTWTLRLTNSTNGAIVDVSAGSVVTVGQ